MPEPELVDELMPDEVPVLTEEDPPPVVPLDETPGQALDETPALAPESSSGQALAPDPPLDQPIMPDPTPPPENYHVAIWEEPVTFPCLRCAARGLTYDEVLYHLSAAHGEAPVPTPLAAQYTPPQTPPASGEEALLRLVMGQQPSEPETTSASEETQGDERSPGDGDLLATDGPGDEPGESGRDEREPDIQT